MSSSLYYLAGSAVGAGAEVTYGSAVARTVWCYPTACTLRPNVETQVREYTRTSATDFNDYEDYISALGWSGNITQELTYDNCGIWLRQLLGAGTTTGPSGSIYQHTYKRALAFPVGLTIEVNAGVTVKDLYTGGKVLRGTLSQDVANRKPVILSLDLQGTTWARSDSAASVTARTSETLSHYSHAVATAGNLNFNSANYPWKRWTLNVDNGLADRRFNGSLYSGEPLRSARSMVSLSAVVDVNDALAAAYLARTQGDVTWTYNDPDSLKLIAFTGHNGKIRELFDRDINGQNLGVGEAALEWKFFTNGTNDGLAIVVDNLTTTAIGQG